MLPCSRCKAWRWVPSAVPMHASTACTATRLPPPPLVPVLVLVLVLVLVPSLAQAATMAASCSMSCCLQEPAAASLFWLRARSRLLLPAAAAAAAAAAVPAAEAAKGHRSARGEPGYKEQAQVTQKSGRS